MYSIIGTGLTLAAAMSLTSCALAKPLVRDRLTTSNGTALREPCPETGNGGSLLPKPLLSNHTLHTPFGNSTNGPTIILSPSQHHSFNVTHSPFGNNTVSPSTGTSKPPCNSTDHGPALDPSHIPLLPLPPITNSTHGPFGNGTQGAPCPTGHHAPALSTGTPSPVIPLPITNGTHSPFGNGTHGPEVVPCPSRTNSTHNPLSTAHQPDQPLPSAGLHSPFGNSTHSPFGNSTEPCHNSTAQHSPSSTSTPDLRAARSDSTTWGVNMHDLSARCRFDHNLPGCKRLFARSDPSAAADKPATPTTKKRTLRGALARITSLRNLAMES